MLKNITIFLIGSLVGALIVVGVAFGLNSQFKGSRQAQAPITTPTQETQESDQSKEPSTDEDEDINPLNQGQAQERLEKLRTQLFQEGIDISATVDKVFPGTGFILEDNLGVKVFTRWTKTSPEEGKAVSVKGTIKRLSGGVEEFEEFKKEPGFNPDLENFLKDQKIIIEAQEVNLP